MKLKLQDIARMIEVSCVQANSLEEEIADAVTIAKRYNCCAVFTLPAHSSDLVAQLKDRPDILANGVVGFPDGGATTAGKTAEARELLRIGCRELDMVLNITWLKAGKHARVLEDIRAVVNTAGRAPVKVILECFYLTNDEIVRACNLAVDAGARFVKTGTGWAPGGATLENIKLMKATVGCRCEVKAAGGVRGLETLLAMYRLGATRFGVGVRSVRSILEAAEQAPNQVLTY